MSYLTHSGKLVFIMGDIVLSERAVVTSKGQIVIPANLRRRLGIRKGTVITFTYESEKLILQPLTPQFIKGLRGSLLGGKAQ